MSPKDSHYSNIHSTGEAPMAAIRGDLSALREQVITTWRERAVILTKDEQAELKQEIADTCELLRLLTTLDR